MWLYEVVSGRIYEVVAGGAQYVGQGYSGFGSAKNDPSKQDIAGLGPIPLGAYEIGPSFDSEHTGKFVMRLTPLGPTDTHGRTAFELHGDSREHPGLASNGCIVQDRPVRERIDASGSRLLVAVSHLPRPLV